MNYTILHIGTFKEPYFEEAFAEYQKRISAFGTLRDIPLKSAKTAGRDLNPSEIAAALEWEARAFENALQTPALARAYKIALCIEGKTMSSESLSALMEKVAVGGQNSVVFLIGSSWGIADRIKQRCDLRLSFSPMTFPHALFRVMLAEQIYRAESILHQSAYHK